MLDAVYTMRYVYVMVYFILEHSHDEKHILAMKIGKANNPESRLSDFTTGNSHRLELWFAVPGSEKVEAWFHSYFQNVRIRGEWFSFSQHIYQDLKDYLNFPPILEKRGRHMERFPLDKCFNCKLECVHKCG